MDALIQIIHHFLASQPSDEILSVAHSRLDVCDERFSRLIERETAERYPNAIPQMDAAVVSTSESKVSSIMGCCLTTSLVMERQDVPRWSKLAVDCRRIFV